MGQTARGGENPRAVPPLNRAGKERGSRCVAITSDSRASCCRADGVFYDRVAAALQGLGGRVLETPRSFLAIECESNGSSETYFLCVLLYYQRISQTLLKGVIFFRIFRIKVYFFLIKLQILFILSLIYCSSVYCSRHFA